MPDLQSTNNALACRLWESTSRPARNNEICAGIGSPSPAPTAGRGAFISPLSTLLALLIVANGTRGVTRQQLMQLLESDDLSVINQQVLDLLKQLPLESANSVWFESTLRPRLEYKEGLNYYFAASAHSLESVEKVNQWCSQATHGMIPQILSTLPNNVALILVNAIYFKGSWKYPFSKEKTVPMPFNLIQGGPECAMCDMMSLETTASSKLQYYESPELQAIVLPYTQPDLASNRPMEAVIILPKHHSHLCNGEQMDFEGISRNVRNSALSEGTLKLPKFKIESEFDLVATLRDDLGITQLFRASQDMEPMVGNSMPSMGLLVDNVIHKTVVEIDEDGTEAAAITAVLTAFGCAAPSPPQIKFHMQCDRPFYFLICEKWSGLMVFLGKIEQPAATESNQHTFSPLPSVTANASIGPMLSGLENLPIGTKQRIQANKGTIDCTMLTAILNEDGITLLNRASQAISASNATANMASTEDDLVGAFQVFQFVSARWLELTGEPFAYAYYNLACVQSLLVELQLQCECTFANMERDTPFQTLVQVLGKRNVLAPDELNRIAIGRAIPPAPNSTSTGSEATVIGMIRVRLTAAIRCLRVAVAAGYDNLDHIKADRDLKALRDLNYGPLI